MHELTVSTERLVRIIKDLQGRERLRDQGSEYLKELSTALSDLEGKAGGGGVVLICTPMDGNEEAARTCARSLSSARTRTIFISERDAGYVRDRACQPQI